MTTTMTMTKEDRMLTDAAREVERAMESYSGAGGEPACRAMAAAFMQMFRAMLPRASDDAIDAMTTLAVIETARARLDEIEPPARIIDVGGPRDARA
jgi:hypothetical protein